MKESKVPAGEIQTHSSERQVNESDHTARDTPFLKCIKSRKAQNYKFNWVKYHTKLPNLPICIHVALKVYWVES